jgi:hypothetical protein
MTSARTMTMNSPRSSRGGRYSHEEMEAILQRALQKQSRAEAGVSHDELIAAAAEVGIPLEHIEAAVDDLEAEQRPRKPDPVALEAAREASLERNYRIHRLLRGFVAWVFVSSILFTIGRNTGHHGMFVFSMVWGIALLMRAVNVAFPKPPRLRRETKRERKERERRERTQQSLEVFERKIAVGTEAISHLIDRARGASTPAPVATHPVAVAAPGAQAPQAAVAKPAATEPRARVDASAFERFVASRTRVGSTPAEAEELDELDEPVNDEKAAGRRDRR